MAGSISESYVSRPFTLQAFGQTGRELIYDVWDTNDEEEVRTLIEGTAPAVYLGRIIDTVEAEPISEFVWKGHVKYIRYDGNNQYTFDIGGGTQKITQSYNTVAYAPPGLIAPNFQGAIGVTDDKVEGVDVVIPTYNFSETLPWEDGDITDAYKTILFNLVGTKNAAPFRNFAAGECQLMGVSGSRSGDENWYITYRFSSSPNASGLTVGTITGISKLGWDYLWVRYADYIDGSAQQLVKRPVACYVETVVPDGDFTQLGI